MIYDRFDRPDTAAGVIGVSTSGIPWNLIGDGSGTCQVINNRFQSGPLAGNENVYFYFINKRQVSWMTAKIRWDAGAGAQVIVLTASGYDPPNEPIFTNNLLHMSYSRTAAYIQIFDNNVFIPVAEFTGMTLDSDVDHDIGWIVLDNQIISVGPGFVLSAVSPRISVINNLIRGFYGQISSNDENTVPAVVRGFFSEIKVGYPSDPIPELFRNVL